MKGFHKNSRRIENEVFILYMSDHELVTVFYYKIEVVNGGVTPIVVTNLVCVPKKKEFVQFSGSRKGAWKHIRTLEWKSKNRCNSSYSGNGKIFGARTQEEGLIRIILTWFLSFSFFKKRIPSRVLLLPVSNRTC